MFAAPSTPHDARRLFLAAVEDPDPVLFYEHIALYRNPRIRQVLPDDPEPLPLGRAALRRFDEPVYLHQVGARDEAGRVHIARDLGEVLDDEGGLFDLAEADLKRVLYDVSHVLDRVIRRKLKIIHHLDKLIARKKAESQ